MTARNIDLEAVRKLMRSIMWAFTWTEAALGEALINPETKHITDQPRICKWLGGEAIPEWAVRQLEQLAIRAKAAGEDRLQSLGQLSAFSSERPIGTEEMCKYICSFKRGAYGIWEKNEAEPAARRILKNEINWGLGFAAAQRGELNILSRVESLQEDVDAHLVFVRTFGRTLYLILVNERLTVRERYARTLDEINVHVRKMVLDPKELWRPKPLLSHPSPPLQHPAAAPNRRLLRRGRSH